MRVLSVPLAPNVIMLARVCVCFCILHHHMDMVKGIGYTLKRVS